jgi:hypothetical protein
MANEVTKQFTFSNIFRSKKFPVFEIFQRTAGSHESTSKQPAV